MAIAAIGAGVVAPVTILGSTPVTAETVKLELDNGVTVSIPTQGDAVQREVRAYNPDGSLKLLVPEGFPAKSLPDRLVIPDAPVADRNDVQALFSHSYQGGHWSSYRWNGVVENANARGFWIIDRSAAGEEPHVQSWVNEYNNGVRASAVHEQGLPLNKSPNAAYYDEDAQDGNCAVYGNAVPNYSFVTTCTSSNVWSSCGVTQQQDPGLVGCAWMLGAGSHEGNSHQPAIFFKAGLSEPYQKRNVVWHEMFHGVSMGHNEESGSIMNAKLPADRFLRFTYHDTWDFSSHYHHGLPE